MCGRGRRNLFRLGIPFTLAPPAPSPLLPPSLPPLSLAAGRVPQPALHLGGGGSAEEHGEQLPGAAAPLRPHRSLLLQPLPEGGAAGSGGPDALAPASRKSRSCKGGTACFHWLIKQAPCAPPPGRPPFYIYTKWPVDHFPHVAVRRDFDCLQMLG